MFEVWSLCSYLLENKRSFLLLSGTHLLEEGNEGHEAIIILWFTQLLHERLGLFLEKLLSEVGKHLEKLISNHGVVVIFVIKLKDFNKVVEATLFLRILASLIHGVDLSLGDHLLS